MNWIIEVGGKLVNALGVLTAFTLIIIGVAKLLGKKWIDLLFEKCIIKYKHKHDKELLLKTAQYNSLLPEQKVIVKELYSKVLRLQQSTKLVVELFDIIKEGFIKEPIINEIEKTDSFEFEMNPICVDKNSKEKYERIFTMDEIEKIGSYHSVKKEVEEYIEQNTIFIPEDIYSNIKVALFLIELFVHMNFPEEFIHYWTQHKLVIEERNKFVNELEEFKQNVGFNDIKVVEVIDSCLALIQNQFRTLLGVENSNQ